MTEFREMPTRDALELSDVLQALSDPVRLEIVAALANADEIACGSLRLPVADSTRSHHLRILRRGGVTATRVAGAQRLVSLRTDDLEARFPGLLAAVLQATSAAQSP